VSGTALRRAISVGKLFVAYGSVVMPSVITITKFGIVGLLALSRRIERASANPKSVLVVPDE
jgi:hypothetical protein